jgi:hypothetical protein
VRILMFFFTKAIWVLQQKCSKSCYKSLLYTEIIAIYGAN